MVAEAKTINGVEYVQSMQFMKNKCPTRRNSI